MSLDAVDLRSFYTSPLGNVATRFIRQFVRGRWETCTGHAVLGIGYATPYLDVFLNEAVRVLAFMPAEQGVMHWPGQGVSSAALVDVTMLPLPDASIDRVLVVHALETSDQPYDLLNEVWRVLTPGGRMIAVVPNRSGMWARVDSTPFGYGEPYSRSQLRELLKEAQFSPINWSEALYVPPFARPYLLRSALAFEKVGGKLALPGAGVHLVEATKQLYSPVVVRRGLRRRAPQLQPALAPARSVD
ncbi:MAG: methyltransferase type 11 [Rhizobiales bacterium 62-17]|nr:class I SAM-dependent methyltransferase [Hyphomicrobiales bacterium]OJY02977.1 MAG: methyltransferase type 11 [Rhizobiales bacterium 62-17]